MNKLFSKIATLSVGLAMAIGVGVAAGSKGVRVAKADEVTISPSDFGTHTNTSYSETIEGISFECSNGTTTSDQVRVFKSATLTISASGLTSIEMTCTASGTEKYGPGCFVADSGYTYSGNKGTWVGEADSVTFTASTNQVRITSFVIAAGPSVTKYTVSFDANGGTGTMSSVKVEDGTEYELPACTFTAPSGKTFDTWSIKDEAKAPGTKITVDEDKTVKAIWKDVVRVDLPEGEYSVDVSYSGRTSVPSLEYFEIKQPVGETYYKNLKVEYSDVQAKYSNEYTMTRNKNSSITVTSNSNARIESVTFDLYQYITAVVEVNGVEVSESVSGKGADHRSLTVSIKNDSFTFINKSASYDQSLWGFTVELKVTNTPDPVVAFDSYENQISVGDTGTFTATSEHATNPVYSWTSSNSSVFDIDASTGEYEGIAPGKVTVTVELNCDEGTDSASIFVNVLPDHTLTVAEALDIAKTLDGDAQETTEYFVKVRGYITNLDADTYARAFNLSDTKVESASDENTILAYGVTSTHPVRAYAVLNGIIEFTAHIQNYKGTYEIKDLTLEDYIDEAMTFAKASYESLQEACNTGVEAVTEAQWTALSEAYADVDEYSKAKLIASDVSAYGVDIQNWINRYTILVEKGSFDDFMNRGLISGSGLIERNFEIANDNTMIIVITIAAVSALAFTTLLVFKKKKQK